MEKELVRPLLMHAAGGPFRWLPNVLPVPVLPVPRPALRSRPSDVLACGARAAAAPSAEAAAAISAAPAPAVPWAACSPVSAAANPACGSAAALRSASPLRAVPSRAGRPPASAGAAWAAHAVRAKRPDSGHRARSLRRGAEMLRASSFFRSGGVPSASEGLDRHRRSRPALVGTCLPARSANTPPSEATSGRRDGSAPPAPRARGAGS